jgi:hypothetical protein
VNAWTRSERRLGFWSASSVALLDVVYVLTGVVWLVSGGSESSKPLEPKEPYLSILEFLLFLSVPPLVALAAALHAYAEPMKKTSALAALAFMTAFATVTCGVHVVRLIVLRQLPAGEALEPSILRLYPWPSILLALDLLAWDLFLGLALLFACRVFTGRGRLHAAIRIGTMSSGVLCLVGFIGPLTGEMRVQFLAIAGYAFVLPATCALMALLFRRATVRTGA